MMEVLPVNALLSMPPPTACNTYILVKLIESKTYLQALPSFDWLLGSLCLMSAVFEKLLHLVVSHLRDFPQDSCAYLCIISPLICFQDFQVRLLLYNEAEAQGSSMPSDALIQKA